MEKYQILERVWDLRSCTQLEAIADVFGETSTHIMQLYTHIDFQHEVTVQREISLPSQDDTFLITLLDHTANERFSSAPIPLEIYGVLRKLSVGDVNKYRQLAEKPEEYGSGVQAVILDSYMSELQGLRLLRVRFISGFARFVLPSWAKGAVEVTDLPLFTDGKLCKSRTIPPLPAK